MPVHQVARRHDISELPRAKIFIAMVVFEISQMGHSGKIGHRRPPVVTGFGGTTGGDVVINNYGSFIDYRDILGGHQHAGVGIGIHGGIGQAIAQQEIRSPGEGPTGRKTVISGIAIGTLARG
jgi:hypothetical protein